MLFSSHLEWKRKKNHEKNPDSLLNEIEDEKQDLDKKLLLVNNRAQ